MTTIALSLLTAACVLLTVVFLGTLRGIVEIRLRLSGQASGSRVFIDSGSTLPSALLEALPDPREVALVVFVSDGCDACKELAAILPTIPVTTVACILGRDGGDIRGHLGAEVSIVDPAVTASAARDLRITGAPVVILQREGRVVGSAYGVSTETADELHRWWRDAQELMKENAL